MDSIVYAEKVASLSSGGNVLPAKQSELRSGKKPVTLAGGCFANGGVPADRRGMLVTRTGNILSYGANWAESAWVRCIPECWGWSARYSGGGIHFANGATPTCGALTTLTRP